MIPVGWLAPQGCWDQTMIADLLSDRLYRTGMRFTHSSGYPNADGCVLVIPGAYWQGQYAAINEAVTRYQWLLAVIVSDELSLFDINAVEHPNVRWWVQTPREALDARAFGVGYTPHTKGLPAEPPAKSLDVFLSAQMTHSRRRQCFAALVEGERFQVTRTQGFTQGMKPADYMAAMQATKVAPCPSGAVSVDSFRAWEALEAHALPVVDAVSPVDGMTDYWGRVFGDAPVPVVTDWDAVDWDALLAGWPANGNRVTAWWMRRKREYVSWLREDLETLNAL